MIKLTTLSSRLTLLYCSVFALLLAICFIFFYVSFNNILLNRIDEDLIEDVAEFKQLLAAEGKAGLASEIKREQMEVGESPESFKRILNFQGQVVYTTDTKNWPALTIPQDYLERAISSGKPLLYDLESDLLEGPSRVMVAPINAELILHIAESLEEKEELMELIQIIIFIMFLLVLPIALLIGWFISKKATSGINAISKIAREIEYGALDKRVSAQMWGDEIQVLADTFNSMLDRIRDLIVEMRELTDNVAHDLRSPLTRIRVVAESALSHNKSAEEYQNSAADIIDECDRLMEMINASLDLAELESGATSMNKNKIDLSRLVEDACEFFLPLAEEKNIQLNFTAHQQLFIFGDMQRLQRMLANMLDNAIKYTQADGSVEIQLSSDKQNVTLTIKDTGIGIPLEEQDKVFERFYRCDQSRLERGCGLGLNFARAVAQAHGGEISLSSVYRKGSVFNISLSGQIC